MDPAPLPIAPDPFNARSTLVDSVRRDGYLLPPRGARGARARRPRHLALHGPHSAGEHPAPRGRRVRRHRHRQGAGAVGSRGPPARARGWSLPFLPGRVVLQDFTGVPAVVDLAAMRDAVARLGGDVTRINPLVPADLVIDHSVQVDRFGTTHGVRPERRFRVRAQPRAVRAPALGAAVVPELPGRSSRDRHRPSGQSRVPGAGGDDPPGRSGNRRLPRHAGRDRFSHDHDQRARRARLGRRRHRGRGGAARSAALSPRARGRRRAAGRGAAGRIDRDRPGAGGHRDAAQARRRRPVRRVLRRRAEQPVARRPRDHRQHGA